jgi:hypothetical protein
MVNVQPSMVGYGQPAGMPAAVREGRRFDPRWLKAALLVGSAISVGVLYATWRGPSLDITFSGQVSLVYCPIAAILILLLGWTPNDFPVAAALFFGYLGLAQAAAGGDYYLAGSVQGAITFEEVLALPLILVGLLGPSGAPPGARPAPSGFRVAWTLILISGLISTVMAISPSIAAMTYLARFLIPTLVILGTYRRLRGIEDYMVVWFGLLIGIVAILVFDYRRAVLDILPWYNTGMSQRYVGTSESSAIPTFYVIGPALWLGHALAVRKWMLTGVGLLLLGAVFCMMLWLGAHRGPLLFAGLLVLWWTPSHVLRNLLHARSMILWIIAAVVIVNVLAYSLSQTRLNTDFIVERVLDMGSTGVTGEARWPIWMAGLEHWAASPLWGRGLNNWVVVDDFFANVHSSVVGILFDTGLIGLAAFGLLFGATLSRSRKADFASLTPLDHRFALGCRAGWVCMMLLLAVELPFTSGQPHSNIFVYTVFLYPMLVMLIYTRRAPVAHPWPGAATAGAPAQAWAARAGSRPSYVLPRTPPAR